jgi:hypothetical protein
LSDLIVVVVDEQGRTPGRVDSYQRSGAAADQYRWHFRGARQVLGSVSGLDVEEHLSDQLHPLAPHHLPGFITAPGETDVWMVVMGVFLIVAVLAVGNFYLQLHSLPERMAHKSQKLQFEIVAVLGLLALFTHVHLFWIAALLLAMIDLPDFGTPLRSIAGSVEKIAGGPSSDVFAEKPGEAGHTPALAVTEEPKPRASKKEAHGHA